MNRKSSSLETISNFLLKEDSPTKRLEASIVEASEAYYLGDAKISDVEFDSMVEKLRKFNPNSPILKQVGWGMKVYGEKTKLPMEIRFSLPKTQSIKDLPTGEEFIVSPKLDGISVILEYRDGHLFKAVTRGDGIHGVDITYKIPHIASNLLFGEGIHRGELFIPIKVFENMEGFANPRNAVAGIVNRKSFEGMEFVSYKSHSETTSNHTKAPYPVDSFRVWRSKVSVEFLKTWYDEWSKTYPIDGLVIIGEDEFEDIAFKFETKEIEGTVDHVEWNLSDRGQMVPVAILKEALPLYGAMVSRVSCYHADYVISNRIGAGSRLMVTRANEIIPNITRVVSGSFETRVPSKCPKCSGKLERSELQLVCNNKDCGMNRHLSSFIWHNWFPKGISDSDSVLKVLGATSFWELASYNREGLREVLSGALALWKAEAISEKASETISRDWFLGSLGIKGVGEVFTKKAAPHLHFIGSYDLEKFIEATNPPSNIRTSLKEKWPIIHQAYDAFSDRIETLKSEVPEEANEVDYCVVLTGKFSVKKSEIEEVLLTKGLGCQSGINRDTKLVVTHDPSSQSGKARRARELGIEMISETELRARYF